jgi:hypothetical protein
LHKPAEVLVYQGRYIRWEPFPAIPGRWYLVSLHHDFEGFRLLLRGEDITGPSFLLVFAAALLYQAAGEGFRLTGPDADSELALPHPFYTVERSSLVAEFHRSSAGAYRDCAVRHFAVYTADQSVDVLSVEEPRAMLLGSATEAAICKIAGR